MSSISKWLCKNNTKNLFVKIVHPGGHVELHDRPILASELLSRNPKCCVAHPNVFQQPYAVLAPETILVLGRKYYIVPIGTIRKLRSKHPRPHEQQGEQCIGENDEGSSSSSSWCWMSDKEKSGEREGDKKSGCFQSMSSPIKIKSRSIESSSGKTIRTKEDKNRGNNRDGSNVGGSTKRLPLVSCDNWQPGLESVVEEY